MKTSVKRNLWRIVGVLIVVSLALRIALEPIVLHYVNKALGNLDGYRGQVDDIDIALYRGAYRIDSLVIEKIDGDFPEPFVNIPLTDISVEWKSLWQGGIVAEVVMEKPVLNFTTNSSGANQSGEDENWVETLNALVPIKINRFLVINGKVKYRDLSVNPKVSIEVTNLNGTATYLSTVEDKNKKLPSRIRCHRKYQRKWRPFCRDGFKYAQRDSRF